MEKVLESRRRLEKVGEGWRRLENVRDTLRKVEKYPKIVRNKLLRTATREALSGLSGEKRERVPGCPPGPQGPSPHCLYYPVLSPGSVNYSHSTFIIIFYHLFTTRFMVYYCLLHFTNVTLLFGNVVTTFLLSF